MITVSDSFKKAIKSANRNIFGYVDIKYQNNLYSAEIEQMPNVLPIYLSNGLVSGSKVLTKYATFENNYTLLDGSFMIWNENVLDEKGYVSDEVFNDIVDSTIIVENVSTTIPSKGITIYFKENLPFNFDVKITDINNNEYIDNITNNTSMTYQYIFKDEIYISQIEIEIFNVEFPNNRLRLAYVDLNISDFYDGDELIDFDVNEECDLLVESLPINTCSIHINNYPTSYGGNKFDPINPKGITKYLNENTTIEPYIGILTEENGIEYVNMGTFYLTDWNSKNDGNVTLNGSSALHLLKGKEMIWNSSMFTNAVYTTNLASMIENTTGIICSFPEYSMPLDNWSNIHTKLWDYFNYISPCLLYNDRPNLINPNLRKIYVNRYNNIVIDNIVSTPVDNIDRYLLLEDVDYITNKFIKDVVVKYTLEPSESSVSTSTIINTTYTLSKPVEYLWFKTDKYIANITNISGVVSYGSASLTYIGNNMHLVHVKIEGDVGSIINITCSASVANSSKSRYTNSFVDETVNDGDTINVDFGDCEIPNVDSIRNVFFDLDKPYKVKAKTMGDPSLEIGDTISIQTRYTDTNNGYKNIIITKQHFLFNGGLQCDIEGFGD